MKTSLFRYVVVLGASLVSLGLPASAELHQFTSADGEKNFWGTLTNFDPKTQKVSVRLSNGRSSVFPSKILSADDREWIKEKYEIIKIGRNVKISVDAEHGGRKVSKSGSQKSIESSKFYNIEISNRGGEVSDLEVKYEVHVSRNGESQVIEGTPESVSTLYSGVPYRFKTDDIALSQSIPLSTYIVTSNNNSGGSNGASQAGGGSAGRGAARGGGGPGGRPCPT